MRLIDADKLPEVNTIERIEGDREVFVNSWIPATAIWKAPTVEAIPIQWIYLWRLKNMDICPVDYIPFSALLNDWEKENETN